MRILPVLIALPLLAACHAKVSDKDDATTATATADGKTATASSEAGSFKIDTDKFKASLEIPGMALGSKDFDIDDMTLLPNSTVNGMAVQSRETDGSKHGKVTIKFNSPGTPDAVLAHAESQAKDKGWAVTRTGDGLTGTKGERTIAYAVTPNGSTTKGSVTITGDE